jgi:hypothetical protein
MPGVLIEFPFLIRTPHLKFAFGEISHFRERIGLNSGKHYSKQNRQTANTIKISHNSFKKFSEPNIY